MDHTSNTSRLCGVNFDMCPWNTTTENINLLMLLQLWIPIKLINRSDSSKTKTH